MYMYKNNHLKRPTETFLMSKTRAGFGLIDFLVLIFLAGLLSTLTLPLIYNKMPQNKSMFKNPAAVQLNKQLYKKAYADASSAWAQVYNEGALLPRSADARDRANYDNFTKFMGKFNVIKQCVYPDNIGCWASNETQQVILGHPGVSDDRCFIDSSGRSWCEAYYRSWFVVDTNGLKLPNSFGKDRFIFYTAIAGDASMSGTPDNIIGDVDYTTEKPDKCPNPPCYFKSGLTDAN